jgi:type VI secretion system VasD/TssJ family lipoprotein
MNIPTGEKEMKKILFLPAVYFIVYLTGCGSGIKTAKINLVCDGDCNGSNAIVVRVYQLNNSDKFSHASFESLLRNPEAALADDLIPNSKFETTLVPGQTFELKDYVIKNGAAYIGVVGDFHSPAKDGWLRVIPVDSDIKPMKILIHNNYLSVE